MWAASLRGGPQLVSIRFSMEYAVGSSLIFWQSYNQPGPVNWVGLAFK